jgi:hypothetical protein
VLSNFTAYLVPVIKLTKSTPKEAVCTVFEKVNTGGVPLNVFELLTATFAGDQAYFAEHGADFRLNDYWQGIYRNLCVRPVLRALESTDYLQAVTLLATYAKRLAHTGDPATAPGVSCKRRDILRLSLPDFLTWAPRVTEGFAWAAKFLGQEHIFDALPSCWPTCRIWTAPATTPATWTRWPRTCCPSRATPTPRKVRSCSV